MVLDDKQYMRVPAGMAHAAFDWLEVRGYLKSNPSWKIAESRLYLDEMLDLNPSHISMTLDSVAISDADRILFKLTFAG